MNFHISTDGSSAVAADAGVLLLGASGFLGPALTDAFGAGHYTATHCHHPRPDTLFFDVSRSRIIDLVDQLGKVPQAAVILAGNTTIDACALDPVGTARVNVDGIIRIVDEASSLGILPVFVSSDGVFDGSRAFWKETDPVCPILEYGRQKAAVERHVASLASPWLIVRLPKLLAETAHPRCMLQGWASQLDKGERILCANDQYFTPAAVNDVARALAQLVRCGERGIFHLGGPRRLSRRALLQLVVEEYEKHAPARADICDCSLYDIPVREPRPLDSSLASQRFGCLSDFTFKDPADIVARAVAAHFSGLHV